MSEDRRRISRVAPRELATISSWAEDMETKL
jgi:hypothetical protein